ncbi:MAG: SDR family NAD(P)-dependent oxidoreductase [Anaerolineaceae bacterium]|nr:SDR family NAD(P)-dependent oxidoreductase [Anaerolineaceae bacterium]
MNQQTEKQQTEPTQEAPVALISGGNSGIGLASALRFVRMGWRVALAARDAGKGAAAVAAVQEAGGEGRFLRCDVREAAQCEAAVAETLAHFGRIDCLVNNAGVVLRNRTVVETTLEEWHRVFEVNLHGAFYLSKYALPSLIEAKGSIVNVSSYVGLVALAGLPAYGAAKGALVQLTRALAIDHAAQGVRANCVCPGTVRTPMTDKAWADYGEGAEEVWSVKHPLGRIAEAEEVAAAICFFASEDASFLTGVIMPVDGGITAA